MKLRLDFLPRSSIFPSAMTTDDRRYMTYEMRAAEGDERFIEGPEKREAREAKKREKARIARREREAKAAEVTTATCTVGGPHRPCGKPAVAIFTVGTETFAECAEHRI